jgi:hypothetical protein
MRLDAVARRPSFAASRTYFSPSVLGRQAAHCSFSELLRGVLYWRILASVVGKAFRSDASTARPICIFLDIDVESVVEASCKHSINTPL